MSRSFAGACAVAIVLAVTPATRPVAAWISEPLDQQPTPQPPQQPTEFNLTLVGVGHQPKVGLPDFTVEPGDKDLSEAVATLVDVLWADLDFEQEYYLIPRKASASIPVVADPQALPFDRWREIGAEFVIVGNVKNVAGNLDIEFRLVAVGSGSNATGQSVQGSEVFKWHYGGSGCAIKNARFCAHFISDDFHKKPRGVDGVARTKMAFSSDRDGARMSGRRSRPPGPARKSTSPTTTARIRCR